MNRSQETKSINSLLTDFMEEENGICKQIPFIVLFRLISNHANHRFFTDLMLKTIY